MIKLFCVPRFQSGLFRHRSENDHWQEAFPFLFTVSRTGIVSYHCRGSRTSWTSHTCCWSCTRIFRWSNRSGSWFRSWRCRCWTRRVRHTRTLQVTRFVQCIWVLCSGEARLKKSRTKKKRSAVMVSETSKRRFRNHRYFPSEQWLVCFVRFVETRLECKWWTICRDHPKCRISENTEMEGETWTSCLQGKMRFNPRACRSPWSRPQSSCWFVPRYFTYSCAVVINLDWLVRLVCGTERPARGMIYWPADPVRFDLLNGLTDSPPPKRRTTKTVSLLYALVFPEVHRENPGKIFSDLLNCAAWFAISDSDEIVCVFAIIRKLSFLCFRGMDLLGSVAVVCQSRFALACSTKCIAKVSGEIWHFPDWFLIQSLGQWDHLKDSSQALAQTFLWGARGNCQQSIL